LTPVQLPLFWDKGDGPEREETQGSGGSP